MGKMAFIIGESGTGKSTSIRNLDPESTYIINICDKDLPFRGSASRYKVKSESFKGNIAPTSDKDMIIKILDNIDKNRKEIKTLIIDDFGYIISKLVGASATTKGYDKFCLIANVVSEILEKIKSLRSDLYTFVTWHTDLAEDGKYKMKLYGKMIENHIKPEGMVSMVFHTAIADGNYSFLTQHDNLHLAKTPHGMFENKLIPNDLQYVIEKMNEYYNDQEESLEKL
jgi:hypothetical protein